MHQFFESPGCRCVSLTARNPESAQYMRRPRGTKGSEDVFRRQNPVLNTGLSVLFLIKKSAPAGDAAAKRHPKKAKHPIPKGFILFLIHLARSLYLTQSNLLDSLSPAGFDSVTQKYSKTASDERAPTGEPSHQSPLRFQGTMPGRPATRAAPLIIP